MLDLLEYDFLRRALIAAVLIGIAAPAVGTFLVQRRLALLGDGIGHIALTGVALGLLTSTSPTLMAALVAALGAVIIEVLRARGTAGDLALALLFYGGLAGGVLVISRAPGGSNSSLLSYLFGSISNVSESDLVAVTVLALVVVAGILLLHRDLFLLCQDEDVARTSGLRVRLLSMLLSITAAVTVVVAMRVVGLLLVSALMVVPVATAQQLTRGFRATLLAAAAIGVLSAVGGLQVSYDQDLPPGPSIVLFALTAFIVAVAAGRLLLRLRPLPADATQARGEASGGVRQKGT